ncbi:Ribose import ATP-binding protein RbsA [Neomoorella glycerini]|uniref:Ribose import ATP-binding protein RbsA n=1 Tax=Neomoorella glycerini TaxID=55779 RepID=A0A6I5ZNR4_9FIRM|nr:sugar ABC transporter ATP-binding protein [Moorella glycerini]QGP91604.1 Ribose import ATP-binding protein RbsA [Moorella glycerini]
MPEKVPVIRTLDISKSFSGINVLNKISFEVYPGEVHALIGENGAGKSTLVKIICGVYQPSAGEIYVDEKKVSVSSPIVARDLGIALIHQEPLSFPDLDIAENIFIGHTRVKNKQSIFVDWHGKYQEARQLLDSLGVKLDVKAKLRGLSVADQQMVEIASALSQNARVIFMDEPTAALTPDEVGKLLDIIRLLKHQGKAIIYISHRLDEIKEISDRVTILRDGEKIGTYKTKDINRDQMIEKMIGRTIKELIPKEPAKIAAQPYLVVKNIAIEGVFKDISFELREGEILGIAGLVGAGRTEVARALFGITPIEKGEIFIRGKKVTIKSPLDAIKYKMALVPEDRQGLGLLLPWSISNNISFSSPNRITSMLGWLKFKEEQLIADNYIHNLRIITRNSRQPVQELSGGNQQKVSLAKWLLTEPKILILDEPTRGIDVGAKTEIYKIINRLAAEGKCIIMISSELPEILTLSDRVLVMYEGTMTALLEREEISEQKVMAAASGQKL